MSAAPLVSTDRVRKVFGRGGNAVPPVSAVENVSISIAEGEALGLVGESGSGKSTLGRMVLGLLAPSEGTVRYRDTDIWTVTSQQRRKWCARRQLVFQDPLSALNPRKTIGANIELPLLNFGWPRPRRNGRIKELLGLVGLDKSFGDRYPHQLSGGQCQRVVIARAIALEPEFLFLDEPVSALDVSIQAQILNLLSDLRESLRLTYLFVSHDLRLVRHMCDRTAVMFHGQLVELGPSEGLYDAPLHPYTRALRGAVLNVDAGLEAMPGTPPDVAAETAENAEASGNGCRYASQCPLVRTDCAEKAPPLLEHMPGHWLACHARDEIGPRPRGPITRTNAA